MAGSWGNWAGSWQRDDCSADAIGEAVESEDPASIARWLRSRDFWLIEQPGDSDADGTAALVLDIDDSPVVAAFTSQRRMNDFAGANLELFEDPERIKGFAVTGENVVLNLPEGGGVLFDSDTDEERYLSPELVGRIRAELRQPG